MKEERIKELKLKIEDLKEDIKNTPMGGPRTVKQIELGKLANELKRLME